MKNWSKDHVGPDERVPQDRRNRELRRHSDRNPLVYNTHIRWGHIAVFIFVVLFMWLGFPPMVEDHFAKLEAERAGRFAGEVVHKLRLNCGI